jgi:microcystin-dependent protein
MSNVYMAQITLFPYNFAPRGWAFCQGQTLDISQNSALYALVGTTYGGNGQTTFLLPQLTGATAINWGQGPGLSNYTIGQALGTDNVTLTTNQIPGHSHTADVNTTALANVVNTPANGSWIYTKATGSDLFSNTAPNAAFNASALQASGAGQPHSNEQPFLALNYCIALEGLFPQRN